MNTSETKVDVLAVMHEAEFSMLTRDGRDQMRQARAAVAEMIEAAQSLAARTFDHALQNDDERHAAKISKPPIYPPAELLWCRSDPLNPCWLPGTPYTGKHWGWTPDMGGDGAVCEHCRLRAALSRIGGAK